jgi:hypothetical protein
MATEQRISRLEGAYEQVDARLADINHRVDSLESNTLTILTVGGWVILMAAIVTLFFAK